MEHAEQIRRVSGWRGAQSDATHPLSLCALTMFGGVVDLTPALYPEHGWSDQRWVRYVSRADQTIPMADTQANTNDNSTWLHLRVHYSPPWNDENALTPLVRASVLRAGVVVVRERVELRAAARATTIGRRAAVARRAAAIIGALMR